jgi:hypothetical protein
MTSTPIADHAGIAIGRSRIHTPRILAALGAGDDKCFG